MWLSVLLNLAIFAHAVLGESGIPPSIYYRETFHKYGNDNTNNKLAVTSIKIDEENIPGVVGGG